MASQTGRALTLYGKPPRSLCIYGIITGPLRIEAPRVPCCAVTTHRRLALPYGLRIHHVDGFPLGEGEQLVDGHAVERFVTVSLGIPQVRGAQGIRHLQQWMRRANDRFFLVHV